MNRTMVHSSWVLAGIVFPVLAAAEPITLPPEALRRSADAAALRPGVIVDPSGIAVYSSNPDGGIDAVSPSSGELFWSTREAAVPLAFHGDLLMAQGPPAERSGILDVVFLDRRAGEPRRKLRLELPEGVWGRVDQGLGATFEVRAAVRDGEPFVSWEHTRRHARGIAPPPGEVLEQKLAGAYRLDFQAGRAVAVDPKAVTPDSALRLPGAVRQWVDSGKLSRAPAPAGEVLAATQVALEPGPERIVLKRWNRNGEPLPDVDLFSGPYVLDLRSADGRHLSVAERVAPGDWEEYRWSVFSLATGRRLGQVRNHRSHAWYFVHDSTLIHVAHPFDRRVGDAWASKPLRLRAVPVGGGPVIWERNLRDTSFRGPFPP